MRLKLILTGAAAPAGVAHTGVLKVCALALAAPLYHAPSVSTIVALHGRAVVVQVTGMSLAACTSTTWPPTF